MLFTDIEGSTRLLHEIGDLYGDVLAEHDRLLRAVWSAHGGVIVHAEGDSFFVAFADVEAAVKAASAAQVALDAKRWAHRGRLRVRMGIHTGVPRVIGTDYWGVDVHYAARVCAAAHGGQVLLSASTRERVPSAAVDDLGAHGLKDFAVAQPLFHLRVAGAGADRFPPPRTLARVRTNLPSAPNRLIGRERELDEMRERLTGEARLLTVTGVGGSGKTRLALACGTDLLEAFSDGVFLARLASVEQPDEVPLAIADALGASGDGGRDGEAAILSYLARRELLLVVDNMEHVLGAAPLLSRLLEVSPGLRLLVTSQAPLRVASEVVMALAPLEVPSNAAHDVVALEQVPAAALFLQRARAADAAFVLDPGDVPAVAELCRRLDGLPLALELAAGRVRVGGPRRLLGALEHGLDVLGSGPQDLPARQRGLRAALQYTVSLLDEDARQLLAALGVFAGAWTIEQTEAMLADELDVWEATATLLDFALVRTQGDGRLAMPEPVRAHAHALLTEQGVEPNRRRCHAMMLAEEARVIDDEFFFATPALAARTLELADEYGAAIRWSSDHDVDLHRRLVGALGIPYYLVNRLATIAGDILERVAVAGLDDTSARLHVAHGMVLASTGDVEGALAAFDRAAECRRMLGDHVHEAIARAAQAHLLYQSGIVDDRGGVLLRAALALPPIEHDHQLRGLLEGELALQHFVHGRIDEADRIISAILADARLDGSFVSVLTMDCWGEIAMARGQFAVALHRYSQELRRARAMPVNGLLVCSGIALALAGLGDDCAAVELDEGVEANIERERFRWVSETLEPPSDADLQLMAAARGRLGTRATAEAQRRGRERDRDEVIDFALALAEKHAPMVSPVSQ